LGYGDLVLDPPAATCALLRAASDAWTAVGNFADIATTVRNVGPNSAHRRPNAMSIVCLNTRSLFGSHCCVLFRSASLAFPE